MHAGAVWGMCKGGEAWWSLISAVIHSDINARDIYVYGAYIQNIFIKVGRVTRRNKTNKTKCSFEHFVRVRVCVCVYCMSVLVCVLCFCVAHIGRRLSLNAWKMINRFIKVQCESKKKKKILLLGRFVLRLLFFESRRCRFHVTLRL